MTASKTIKYLTLEEIEALFTAISDPRDRAIFRVAYHRGLRASEVGLLELSDFRPAASRLMVHRCKGSNGGEFPLAEVEARSLRAWLRERGNAPGPLFPSRERTAITKRRLDQLMKKYCAAAGIARAKAHFHSLRHSCGTHLAEMGEDLLVIQDHLGHRNIQNTLIYTAVTNKARDAAGERLRGWGKRGR
jgi:type 1 fimbriae regulatory protein FimB